MRNFVGVDLTHESAPDATMLLKFRGLLEHNVVTARVFDENKPHLASKGLSMREGAIVDTTLIAAPSFTKNKDSERDPEMLQSKKGDGRHFGMTAHVGVDMATDLLRAVVGTPGNVPNVTHAHAQLHGGEKAGLGAAGYQGVAQRAENANKVIDWHTTMRPGLHKELKKNHLGRAREKLK